MHASLLTHPLDQLPLLLPDHVGESAKGTHLMWPDICIHGYNDTARGSKNVVPLHLNAATKTHETHQGDAVPTV